MSPSRRGGSAYDWVTAVVFGLLGSACHSPRPSVSVQDASSPALAAPATATGRGAASSAGSEPRRQQLSAVESWRDAIVEAVRGHRYADAAKLFDAPPVEETLSAEWRYLRARVEAELNRPANTLRWLDGLETALPILANEIVHQRNVAQAKVAPSDAVLTELSQSSNLSDALVVAQAEAESGQVAAALKRLGQWEKKLASKSKRLADRAKVRRQRADLLLRQDRKAEASADLLWLCLSAAATPSADGVDALYEQISGKRLKKLQRYRRAEEFTKHKHRRAAIRELELMAKAPGQAPRPSEVLRTRAWAEYKSRGDYVKAASLFDQAAKLSSSHRAQDWFYAARALSRAHQDAEAIVRYQKLARQFPRSGYAEQARYRAARLHYILGQWQAAEQAYADYLQRYSRGKKLGRYDSAVRYEQSVTQLALKQGGKSTTTLQRLIQRQSSQREKANLRQLLGLAWLQAGDRSAAQAAFHQVMGDRPLSFAALLAEVRLYEADLPVPVRIPTAESAEMLSPLEVTLPKKVALLRRIGLDSDAENELKAQSASLKERFAPHGGRALCQAYGQLSTAKQRYRHALSTVRERALLREITPATRWAWDCIYPRPYLQWVGEKEAERQLPAGLIHAVMRQESAFQPTVVSHANAVGLMQLIPPTARSVAKELGVSFELRDLRSPQVNIEFGSFYLQKLLKRFGGHVPSAVASYNAGPGAVDRWLSSGRRLPLDLFVARIPYKETRGYVRRVVGNWARYRYLTAGLGAVPELTLELPQTARPDREDY